MDSWEPGVFKQMCCEQLAADNLGLPWRSRLFAPAPADLSSPVIVRPRLYGSVEAKSVLTDILHRISRRVEYRNWILGEQENFDTLLVRYSTANPLQLTLAKKLSRPVLSVHHSLEVEQLQISNHPLKRVLMPVEKIFGKKFLTAVQGMVAVTDEIARYETTRSEVFDKPVFLYPNGILVPDDQEVADRRGKFPEVLFVSSKFNSWQGLDRLLDCVEQAKDNCVFHLVGRLNQEDSDRASRVSRIKIHGELTEVEIKALTEQCWIGLSALAVDRKGMVEACPLKVREYLGYGLPAYGSHQDVFPEEFDFYKNGSINLREILDFAYKMRDCPRAEVISAALPYISKELIVQKLYRDLVLNLG